MRKPDTEGALGEFTFALATAADDADIRRLLAANPVPGRVTVAYERSPDYFLGCGTLGPFHQVMAVRHRPTGELAAIACRAVRPLYVNGRPEEVGYLGQLRVDQRFRGRWLVSGAFRFLGRLHRDGRAADYLTTIIEANREAEGVLVHRRRRHFPVYREVDRLHTLALSCRSAGASGDSPCLLEWGSEARLPEILAFFHRHGAARQFFPCWSEADFRPGSPTTLGFRLEDLALAVAGGQLVGVLGLWDQSAYKQAVVRAYGGALRWGRPLYDLAGRLRGARPLPRPSEPLRLAYAAFGCLAEADPAVFSPLLAALCRRAGEGGHDYLLLGLTERDPLLPVARRRVHIPYLSRLYTVGWDGCPSLHERLDGRICHVEIATL
jgi:hypothetical protein